MRSVYESCRRRLEEPSSLHAVLAGGPEVFADPSRRFDVESLIRLIRTTEDMTGDNTIGLKVGQDFRPSTFQDIGYGMIFSSNLREALAFNQKYQRLTQEAGTTRLVVDDASARIVWTAYHADAEWMRPITEAVFSGYAAFGRWISWMHQAEIRAMHFRHSESGQRAACEELFACPVHFDSDEDALVMPQGFADAPLPQSNPALVRIVSKRLDRALEMLEAPATTHAQVFRYVETMLGETTPTLLQIATSMGISPRTLRRRLSAEGHSFRDVVDAVRRETCEIYLHERSRSTAEIAQLLGYSEQSAFTRAFKRWFGMTPSKYLAGK